MNADLLLSQIGQQLRKDFAELYDTTPNPKGAKPTREALDERHDTSEKPPCSSAP